MPIRYELDDVSRRVVVTVEGLFQTDDIFAIMARQRAEHTWGYGILYDLRGMTGRPTVGELRQLMSEAVVRQPGEEPRGPVALLATDWTLYGRLCTYAVLGRSTPLSIEVFRDRSEAEQWLSAQARYAPSVALPKEHRRPNSGDLVIWDPEPEQVHPRYWVRLQSRGSDTQLFEGPDAWAQACSAAEERAGPEGAIWKRYKDGHFEKVMKS